MELDHELAQDIVNRAMAILPHNVNVMDSQGLILGSGEPGRIYTRHEGAQLVIANGRIVEIEQATALGLRNSLPGVNVPLMIDNKLIGVLGITGDPDQVRTYAALVRMTAEMLLAQRVLQTQQHWREQRREALQAVLLAVDAPSPALLAEAIQLDLKPLIARLAVGLELTSAAEAMAMSRWLRDHFQDSWCSRVEENTLLWCRPSTTTVDMDALVFRARQRGCHVLRIAEGGSTFDLHTLREEAHQLCDLLVYGRQIQPTLPRLSLGTYRLQACLWRLKDDPAIKAWLAPIQLLVAHDPSGSLLITLKAWCLHHGQVQVCADYLGLHRNTLRYRIEKIRSITGLSPDLIPDLTALCLGSTLVPPSI